MRVSPIHLRPPLPATVSSFQAAAPMVVGGARHVSMRVSPYGCRARLHHRCSAGTLGVSVSKQAELRQRIYYHSILVGNEMSHIDSSGPLNLLGLV